MRGKNVSHQRRVLNPKRRAFVRAYTTPNSPSFGNGSAAYQAAYGPKRAPVSEANASRLLSDARVHQEVEAMLSAAGLTKRDLEQELCWNLSTAKTRGTLSEHREAVNSLAKLRGDLVDKSEVKTLAEDDREAVRKIVSDALRGTPN